MKHGGEFGPRVRIGDIRRDFIARHIQPHKINLSTYEGYVVEVEREKIAVLSGADIPVSPEAESILVTRVQNAVAVAKTHNTQEDEYAIEMESIHSLQADEKRITDQEKNPYLDQAKAREAKKIIRRNLKPRINRAAVFAEDLKESNNKLIGDYRSRPHHTPDKNIM